MQTTRITTFEFFPDEVLEALKLYHPSRALQSIDPVSDGVDVEIVTGGTLRLTHTVYE